MPFSEWLTANGWDVSTLDDKKKANLLAAWKAETSPPPPAPKEDKQESKESKPFDDTMAAIDAESERVCEIRELTTAAARTHVGNPDKIKTFRAMCDAAVKDQKTTVEKYKLALWRADHTLEKMNISAPSAPQLNEEVMCRRKATGKVPWHWNVGLASPPLPPKAEGCD